MTAKHNYASDAPGRAENGDSAAPVAGAGSFVLNLCSSTTPMALAQTELPELKRFTFFVSRRFEEGRERFRLHMGYFATLAEAEEWLSVVRDIYPGAWAGEAPGRKLRARAAAAAAAQAQHAAGPQSQGSSAARAPAPRQPPALQVPVVHAAAPAPRAAPPVVRAAVVSPPLARPAAPPAFTPAVARPQPPSSRNPAGAPRVVAKAPPAVAARPAPAARTPTRKPVFEDSNVREVLKALGDASATGETREMPPPPPRPTSTDSSSLSDTQVLKMLEARRPDGAEPVGEMDASHGGIPLLKPDDTGTRRALKEAVTRNAPVSFAVQLQWSVQPADLNQVPPLAIFSAYTLYTVEGSREGRKWYGLRLGFFSDAISAKQVAYYVRSEFTSVAVVPVSPQEKARATDQDVKAATLSVPMLTRGQEGEFKLLDDDVAAPAPAATPRTAHKPPAKPKAAAGRTRERGRQAGKLGARTRSAPHTLEETLEILGASELTIDNGRGETLNESGVRHLRVEVQKNSPFSKLLERLSERVKKL